MYSHNVKNTFFWLKNLSSSTLEYPAGTEEIYKEYFIVQEHEDLMQKLQQLVSIIEHDIATGELIFSLSDSLLFVDKMQDFINDFNGFTTAEYKLFEDINLSSVIYDEEAIPEEAIQDFRELAEKCHDLYLKVVDDIENLTEIL